mgnify:CR=1 FL=1
MSKFKSLLLAFIPLSTLLPYSNTCGSPLITTFATNRVNQNLVLSGSNEAGSVSTFFVRNLSTNDLEEIQFQLLVSDGVSNFYGEVSEISNGNIDIVTIDALFQTFTSSTLDADLLHLQNGIKAAEEDVLGLPPTVEGNSEVNILFMDIRDGYSNSGEFVAGFFDPQDQFMCYDSRNCDSGFLHPTTTESNCVANNFFWQSCGNGQNIIYIDSNPATVDENGLEDALFTLAHEYQHLLHWNADVKEGHFQTTSSEYAYHNPWVNEGISDLMPSILGLGESRDYTPYLENSFIGLDEWHEIGNMLTLPYYAKSALFFQYLYELEGLEVIGAIFNSTEQGIASIKSIFGDEYFEWLYIHWIQSLILGELVFTQLSSEVYSKNIESYISIGSHNTSIEMGQVMPKYSFALFSVPEYLSTISVNSNLELNISLFTGDTLFNSEHIIDNGTNEIEKIIAYAKDDEINGGILDISYRYIISPDKNNLFVYPNPITGNTLSYIYFGDQSSTAMSIKLFNLKGEIVLVNEANIDPYGNYDGNLPVDLSSGIYIFQSLLDSGVSESRLITIIK